MYQVKVAQHVIRRRPSRFTLVERLTVIPLKEVLITR